MRGNNTCTHRDIHTYMIVVPHTCTHTFGREQVLSVSEARYIRIRCKRDGCEALCHFCHFQNEENPKLQMQLMFSVKLFVLYRELSDLRVHCRQPLCFLLTLRLSCINLTAPAPSRALTSPPPPLPRDFNRSPVL